MIIVVVEGFMNSAYQVDERTKRCSAVVCQKEGKMDQLGNICSNKVPQNPSTAQTH